MRGLLVIAFGALGAALIGCGRSEAESPDAAVLRKDADPYALQQDDCSDAREATGVAVVNAARALAGAPPAKCLALLSAMAANHHAYLAANSGDGQTDRHAETAGLPGFTGAGLNARAAYVGLEHDAFWLSEGVGGVGTPEAVTKAHLAGVYHRSHLLTPGLVYLAWAESHAAEGNGQVVLNSLAWTDVQGRSPALYPGRGMNDVPLAFNSALENPDPMPNHHVVGFPISVHMPRYLDGASGEEPSLVVQDFTLTRGSEPVTAQILTVATDGHVFGSDAFLVPLTPLAPDTEYTATAHISYGDFEFNETWSFRTTASELISRYP